MDAIAVWNPVEENKANKEVYGLSSHFIKKGVSEERESFSPLPILRKNDERRKAKEAAEELRSVVAAFRVVTYVSLLPLKTSKSVKACSGFFRKFARQKN